jgi:hypothetical protein
MLRTKIRLVPTENVERVRALVMEVRPITVKTIAGNLVFGYLSCLTFLQTMCPEITIRS